MVDTSASIDAIAPDDPRCWPSLPLAQWADTCATLHRWSQVVGKVKLALTLDNGQPGLLLNRDRQQIPTDHTRAGLVPE